MKKLFVTFALATLAVGAFGQATIGSLTYQSTGGSGKEKYIYAPDPSAPTVAKNGGALGDYAAFTKLSGTDYTAELWYASGAGASESSLKAVAGSAVAFRTGTSAGLIAGKSKLDIPDSKGGDVVTLQLRVWKSAGGATWENTTERGASGLWSATLSGVNADGVISAPYSLSAGLTYFSLASTIPEPSVVALGALGLGALLLRRRK